MGRRQELNKLFENLSKDLSKLLIKNKVLLIKTDDGRSDSIINESTIIKYVRDILSKYKDVNLLDKAKTRNWCDFSFEYKNKLVPVNIKMSSDFGNDNVSSKKGIIWAFSDLENLKGVSYWPSYKKVISENISPTFGGEKDYYFLIVNKNDLKDIFFTSIKQINVLSPNANNLPFQANWNNNRQLIDRTNIEAYKYVFSVWKDSMDKLKEIAESIDAYENNLPYA